MSLVLMALYSLDELASRSVRSLLVLSNRELDFQVLNWIWNNTYIGFSICLVLFQDPGLFHHIFTKCSFAALASHPVQCFRARSECPALMLETQTLGLSMECCQSPECFAIFSLEKKKKAIFNPQTKDVSSWALI